MPPCRHVCLQNQTCQTPQDIDRSVKKEWKGKKTKTKKRMAAPQLQSAPGVATPFLLMLAVDGCARGKYVVFVPVLTPSVRSRHSHQLRPVVWYGRFLSRCLLVEQRWKSGLRCSLRQDELTRTARAWSSSWAPGCHTSRGISSRAPCWPGPSDRTSRARGGSWGVSPPAAG